MANQGWGLGSKYRVKVEVPEGSRENVEAKNTLKTVLARSGAEINDFLCFGAKFSPKSGQNGQKLRISLTSPGAKINGF